MWLRYSVGKDPKLLVIEDVPSGKANLVARIVAVS